MKRDEQKLLWIPAIRKADGPVYLAIADALSADIRSGKLAAGARLPPQRALADALKIDFTTVSRAYAEASKRGLVEGKVGQGTYVRTSRPSLIRPVPSGLVDMSMNLPPRFDEPGLMARMWGGISGLQSTGGFDLLMRYQEAGGARRDREAGALWLSSRLEGLRPERILVCPGAQGALVAVVGVLAAPGDTICVESLTYPGVRSVASHLRVKLATVSIDDDGIIPESFEKVCVDSKPKALYCNPTIHNPTTATLSLARRHALVEIARRHQVPIIEDDAYGALPLDPLPPLAAIAPELVYHIAGLAKCIAPALRIAYLVVPDGHATARLSGAIRATASMASPLTAAIASRWIEDGTAEAVVAAIRQETAARQIIAAGILPSEAISADPEGFHIWLRIASPWTRGEFSSRLQLHGISVVASDAFALSSPPEAVRLGLGAPETRDQLAQSLRVVADLLDQSPSASTMVV
ncbi:transcriptional regulator with HTH domain and aminotransferase domain [Hoeflea sp. IMCC20628]|uniref:aminotransferase-like domain-containing protein n=1 Tax=Hoeflea sp. IMCC20628 TaxID=1620421 RepID=UPI00063AF43B|nr:PLP-dependent aminotransferase family protein [Hoeflea sp. IMCC20628]AKH99652.1 transcriptional regulator with HTH domain and aminotransferase domain [Hoeflea sp. IMCC20628]